MPRDAEQIQEHTLERLTNSAPPMSHADLLTKLKALSTKMESEIRRLAEFDKTHHHGAKWTIPAVTVDVWQRELEALIREAEGEPG